VDDSATGSKQESQGHPDKLTAFEAIKMAKILIIDDDDQLTRAIQSFLELRGYVADAVFSGEDGLQLLAIYTYDVIVLDWLLPNVSGLEVCDRFRKSGGQTPIIFLTGKTDLNSIEIGLESGADDYLVKPFYLRELHARLKVLLKRRTGLYVEKLTVGGLTLNPETGRITRGCSEIPLRSKEAALLEFLMRRPNRAFSAKELLNGVWSADTSATTGTVRTWINFLRQKLANAGCADLITTGIGGGYIIEDPDVGEARS
jgi:DNA-binding response OmpR family regulator